MQDLLEAIREEASPAAWSQGVRLSRSGTLQGKRTEEGELELRIATAGGMMSPLVVLSPSHGDWSCECPSREPVCQHVAAAIITLHQAEKDGRDLLGVQGPGARVHYAFSEQDGKLCLARLLLRGEAKSPLSHRLASTPRKGDGDVATTRADIEIDLLLGPQRPGPLPSPYVPRVLSLLAKEESDQVSFEGKTIKVGAPAHVLTAQVRDHKDGFEVIAAPTARTARKFDNGALVFRNRLCPLADPLSGRDIEQLQRGKLFAFGEVADLVGRVIPQLEKRLPVDVKSKVLPSAQAMPPRLSLSSESVDNQVRVLATLVYGDPPSARVDSGRMTYLGGALPLRDVTAEARLTQALKQASGLDVGRPRLLDPEQAVELSSRVEQLGNVHFAGEGLSAFRTHGGLAPDLAVHADGFDVSFRTDEGLEASAEAVMAAWRTGSPLVALNDGGFSELPADWLAKHGQLLMDLLAARAAANDEGGKLSPVAAMDLARLCESLEQPPPPQLAAVRELLDGGQLSDAKPQFPSDLTATLRDYQHEGVGWMQSLRRVGMGALLADDMGLGKTVQALCVIESPTLVVCPASVLFNWRAELEKFRPSLRVHTYHGPQRRLDDEADVTLTTYAIMRLDRDALGDKRWNTVVLDEAQTIKNPESKVAQAAYALKADFRLALTGTPVENRLEDLWSQMHFLNRGLLGGRRDFQERYAQPITDGDAAASARLRARIKPLLLRRLKSQVASELPPRTDIVLRCSLDERERALYQTVQAAAREHIVEQLDAGGNVLAALEALLRLRQACCHPALLPGQQAEDSSKLRLLRETLEEVVSEGHKALVFSQWTSLLDLVEPGLRALDIGYVRLDGSTRDRGAVVEKFQSDATTPVMLLSLKAGGVGLNLTAADHVFMLDPWWNPAVEDQAADRAHRIGQERPVFVHRLVAENSVEERILELQRHKRALAEAATEGSAAVALSRDDLLALLS